MKHIVSITLPPEFVQLCKQDRVHSETVLCGFIADLCDLLGGVDPPRTNRFASNGSDERRHAREYYERVGYPRWHRD